MQYFYSTDEMDKNMAGEGYSPAKGSWVTGEKIIFGLITIPAGTKSEPHNHPNEQFSYVLQGRVRMVIAGKSKIAVPGDIIHTPAGAVHSATVIGDEDHIFITCKDASWGIHGIKAGESKTKTKSAAKKAVKKKTKKKTVRKTVKKKAKKTTKKKTSR